MAKFRYQKQPEIYRIGSIQVQNLKKKKKIKFQFKWPNFGTKSKQKFIESVAFKFRIKKKKISFSLNGQISVPKATRNL